MRWFLALNEQAFHADRYADLLKVAVVTAAETSGLVPHLLYDGSDNALTDWLRGRGGQVIPCRSFAYEQIAAIAQRRGDPNILSIGAGTMLRMELPRIVRREGMEDRFVFYTDLDVMFVKDVRRQLDAIEPRVFAVAPEFDRLDYVRMNCGAMIMNVDAMLRDDDELRAFVSANLEQLVGDNLDQRAYQRFYGRSWLMTRVRGPRWQALAPEFNWKPYWSPVSKGAIIHFHGPKPHDLERLRADDLEPHERWMTKYAGAGYEECARRWRAVLSRVNG